MSAGARVAAIHSAVFAGGVAALSWEVVWQLQASLTFGISAVGTALTLAATMGGMTLGSLAAGRWLARRGTARPLRLYGKLELAIGLSGLLMLPAFRGLEALDAWAFSVAEGLAPPLQLLGVALVLGPATFAMGATVPLFAIIAHSVGTSVSRLYAANTAGAALGVLAISFTLLPTLGVTFTCVLVASLNGAVCLVSRQLEPDEAPAAAAAAPAGPPARASFRLAQLVVLCTGLATFGLEVAWFRALRAAFWSTSSTFAIMLAALLIPLAAGARLVPWMRRRAIAPWVTLAAAAPAILLATPLVERIDLLVVHTGTHPAALALWLAFSLLAMGPAVLCLATALPWFLEEHAEPARVGRLYAVNAVGAVAGSLLGAFLLLPTLGFARAAWALGLLVAAAALLAAGPRLRRGLAIAALSAAALAVAHAWRSSPGVDRPLHGTDFAGMRPLAQVEGPDFTTTVIEAPDGTRNLLIDGFRAGSDNPVAAHYMEWMGRLPALLHAAPHRGLVICFGTGQTANGLRHEGVEALDIVDISQSVFDLAPYFEANEAVLEDPRVRSVTMDGRAWLRRTAERYDLITLEPMPPNFAGVNSLYSREFYAIMLRRLEAEGVVAQWLPIHLLTPHHAASVARTFVEAFPDAALWFDPVGGTGILLGRRAGSPEPLGARWPGLSRPTRGRDLDEAQVRRGLLLDRADLARFASAGGLVTDDNQMLQFSQLRAGLQGERGRRLTRENLGRLAEISGQLPYRIAPDGRGPAAPAPR